MVDFVTRLCEQILRIPPPPGPPPGDETTARSFRAAPNYFKYLMLIWGLKTLATAVGLLSWIALMMPALIQGSRKRGWDNWTILFTAIEVFGLFTTVGYWAYSWFAVRLDYDKRWYVVTDRSLRVREGILLVREATVTFANIQNLSISQGPLQRLLGIADLRVDTAGGGASNENKGVHNLHTTFFRGVSNADEIRELMQQRLRRLKDAGLGDQDDGRVELASTPSEFLTALRQVHAESVRLREAAGRIVRPPTIGVP